MIQLVVKVMSTPEIPLWYLIAWSSRLGQERGCNIDNLGHHDSGPHILLEQFGGPVQLLQLS